ncbi:hypothetical protein [Streptosporangium sp. G12]
MGRYVVRDPATREIEIDESALPFWEHREGYTIVGPAPEPDAKPAPGDTSSGVAQPTSGEPTPPEEPGTPTTPRKAASRPAQNVEGAGPR